MLLYNTMSVSKIDRFEGEGLTDYYARMKTLLREEVGIAPSRTPNYKYGGLSSLCKIIRYGLREPGLKEGDVDSLIEGVYSDVPNVLSRKSWITTIRFVDEEKKRRYRESIHEQKC